MTGLGGTDSGAQQGLRYLEKGGKTRVSGQAVVVAVVDLLDDDRRLEQS